MKIKTGSLHGKYKKVSVLDTFSTNAWKLREARQLNCLIRVDAFNMKSIQRPVLVPHEFAFISTSDLIKWIRFLFTKIFYDIFKKFWLVDVFLKEKYWGKKTNIFCLNSFIIRFEFSYRNSRISCTVKNSTTCVKFVKLRQITRVIIY